MTLDTNSNYLSKFLFGRGVDVVRISVIPDEEDAKAFDVPLEVHEPTKEALRQYLVADHRGHDLNDDRLRMVTFPQVKAIMSNVLMANAIWDWGKHDRAKLPPDHAVRTKAILVGILSDLGRVLMLPTFTRGRHRFTTSGMHEAKEFMHAFHYLCRRITFSTTLLHRQVEVMKDAGLPANEASRINQYHWYIQARIDKLCHIKLYRTPQATRSFTRLCILALPLLYGPYYVYIATAGTTNFAFALTLSMATSLIMIGIFNVEKALEDPFTEEGLDGVKVERAMHRILDALDVVVPPSTTPRAKK
ncbi:hypothetical protein DYB30_006612 [Aphanomyces astaci]|uniref:Uncharacterized protein n=1 Tax=Aphanomyces astaci TaxID=112090 RepID=A0A397DQA9_APHAT|nr:hypothetical protein DYB30_006612 [Aphanomyces astaci]